MSNSPSFPLARDSPTQYEIMKILLEENYQVKKMLPEKNILGVSVQGTVYSQEDAVREEYSRSFSTGYSV